MSAAKKTTEKPAEAVEETAQEEKTVIVNLPFVPGNPPERFASCNGIEMYVKCGEDVEVPQCIAEVLANSSRQMMNYARIAQAVKNVYVGEI